MLIALCAALCLMPAARADEGMWLLPLLEKMNAEALSNLGSRLTPDQIYSINHSSIKDAIVQFGGGCTGEIVSSKGLLLTNHHCGYSSIQALSTPEHNYLEDGYWAGNLSEELRVPGLSVKFLKSMSDITDKMGNEAAIQKAIDKAREQNPGCSVSTVNFYNDNVLYLVVYKIYRDVRFVGAPPASMGKFGGETDNWMWPRHTCDFSTFRVYADKNGEPGEYSEDNVPLECSRFLNVSLKGVEEGDFAMIMGYPGRTQRFQTAAELESMIESNAIRIAARTVKQNVWWKAMRADQVVSLKYASKYASSSNGWKKWIGMEQAFDKLDIIERQKAREAALEEWIQAKGSRVKKFGGAIEGIRNSTEASSEPYKAMLLLSETLMNIELLNFDEDRDLDRQYKNYDAALDRQTALALTRHYIENVQENYRIPITVEEVEEMFDRSVYSSEETLRKAIADSLDLRQDPKNVLAKKIGNKNASIFLEYRKASEGKEEDTKKYAAALLEKDKDKPSYPDANMTCRLTYGTVKGYEPKDGVIYKYYTTLEGVIQKEEPDNYEFRVPAKVKELYKAGDYGQYADADGRLRTCFLTNLDITGGNSGSPVMDADGNLIGLAFDGNWEAMSSDVLFEPELQRCICVDIRYVLWMMDKVGGAGYLLDEMNIVR